MPGREHPRVPGATQHAALSRRDASQNRDRTKRRRPRRSRLCGAPLRKGYALHRVRDADYVSTPTIAPIKHVTSVPEMIDFNPSALISPRRSGAMVPRPPIMMPRLAKLAKPHIA